MFGNLNNFSWEMVTIGVSEAGATATGWHSFLLYLCDSRG